MVSKCLSCDFLISNNKLTYIFPRTDAVLAALQRERGETSSQRETLLCKHRHYQIVSMLTKKEAFTPQQLCVLERGVAVSWDPETWKGAIKNVLWDFLLSH